MRLKTPPRPAKSGGLATALEVPMQEDSTTRTIRLTQGFVAIVDADDYEWLSQISWCVTLCGPGRLYARGFVRGSRAPYRRAYMHRFILDAPRHLFVDHINGDGLDNRRANLRLASNAENNRNRHSRSASGHKGVRWEPERQQYRTYITVGSFADPIDAALAYDMAAITLFGEFARPNFLRYERSHHAK